MSIKLTPRKVMQYQAGGLFMCTLIFAAAQMFAAAGIALLWTLIGVFLQLRVEHQQSTVTEPD